MDSITIRHVSFAEIEASPTFRALLDEYGQESAIPEFGTQSIQRDIYLALEQSGATRVLAAFHGDELIGFVSVVVSVIPHFGKMSATTESFFVGRAHRKTGAGMALLREAEKHAAAMGAIGLFVCAPVASRLAKVMPHIGYRETNHVFFRALQ